MVSANVLMILSIIVLVIFIGMLFIIGLGMVLVDYVMVVLRGRVVELG